MPGGHGGVLASSASGLRAVRRATRGVELADAPASVARRRSEIPYERRRRPSIAEDEPLLRGELKGSSRRCGRSCASLAEAEDGIDALRAARAHSPDMMFLDIQMPGLSGMEVARAASGRCHVVFVTAYDQYAVARLRAGRRRLRDQAVLRGAPRHRDHAPEGAHRAAPADLEGLLKALGERRRASAPYLRWINASQGRTCASSPSRKSAISRPTASTRWSSRPMARR